MKSCALRGPYGRGASFKFRQQRDHVRLRGGGFAFRGLGITKRMGTVSLNSGLADREWLQTVADHYEASDNVALAATSLTLTWAAVREGRPHDLVTALLTAHDSPADPRCELTGQERQNLAAFESLVRDRFVLRTADGWLLRVP